MIQSHARQWGKLYITAQCVHMGSYQVQCSLCYFLFLSFFSATPTFTHHFSMWDSTWSDVLFRSCVKMALVISFRVHEIAICDHCVCACVCGTWQTCCLGTVGDSNTLPLVKGLLTCLPRGVQVAQQEEHTIAHTHTQAYSNVKTRIKKTSKEHSVVT